MFPASKQIFKFFNIKTLPRKPHGILKSRYAFQLKLSASFGRKIIDNISLAAPNGLVFWGTRYAIKYVITISCLKYYLKTGWRGGGLKVEWHNLPNLIM